MGLLISRSFCRLSTSVQFLPVATQVSNDLVTLLSRTHNSCTSEYFPASVSTSSANIQPAVQTLRVALHDFPTCLHISQSISYFSDLCTRFPTDSTRFPNYFSGFPATFPDFRATFPDFRLNFPVFRFTLPAFRPTLPDCQTLLSTLRLAIIGYLTVRRRIINISCEFVKSINQFIAQSHISS